VKGETTTFTATLLKTRHKMLMSAVILWSLQEKENFTKLDEMKF
jgi:hypothetical protein